MMSLKATEKSTPSFLINMDIRNGLTQFYFHSVVALVTALLTNVIALTLALALAALDLAIYLSVLLPLLLMHLPFF